MKRERPRIGIGFRQPLGRWILSSPGPVECVEITAEHFFERDLSTPGRLKSLGPVYVHGLGLSLGTPGKLNAAVLEQFKQVADASDAEWVSEHVAFTRSGGIDLGHLNPVPRTTGMLQVLVDHVREVSEYCARPMIVENITTHLDAGGEFRETDFLNRLCDTAGCGLLFDVTNLFINGRNHAYCPEAWLREIQPEFITQLHVVGYSKSENGYQDHHGAPIQSDLMELVAEVVSYAPVRSIILERDSNFEDLDEIQNELLRLKNLVGDLRNADEHH